MIGNFLKTRIFQKIKIIKIQNNQKMAGLPRRVILARNVQKKEPFPCMDACETRMSACHCEQVQAVCKTGANTRDCQLEIATKTRVGSNEAVEAIAIAKVSGRIRSNSERAAREL